MKGTPHTTPGDWHDLVTDTWSMYVSNSAVAKKKKYLSDSSRDCYLLRIFLQCCLRMLEELLFFAALHYVFILLSFDVLGGKKSVLNLVS